MCLAPSSPSSFQLRSRVFSDLLNNMDKGRNDSMDRYSVSIGQMQTRQKHVLALLTPLAGALLLCAWHPHPRGDSS